MPFANPYIWYYGVIAAVTIFIGWAIILAGHAARETSPCDDDRGWPYNAKMWNYSIQGIIPPMFWTLAVILFMWGSFHIDTDSMNVNHQILYRGAFTVVMILNIIAFVLFYVLHNIVGALSALILMLVITIGITMLITERHTTDAWFAFIYIVWIAYTIYFTWYALHHNADNPDVHNML